MNAEHQTTRTLHNIEKIGAGLSGLAVLMRFYDSYSEEGGRETIVSVGELLDVISMALLQEQYALVELQKLAGNRP